MEAPEKRKAVPPYVAFRTLSNFLDRFKQGLPARIDRGLMGSMSGAAQSQVTTSLRFLGMISEHGIPTQLMRQYVTGEEEERKGALREMLEQSYPFVFNGGFDFASATGSQLREVFEANTTATGETLDRCTTFLKDAAREAGITVSPFILQKKPRSASSKKRPAPTRRDEKVAEKPSVPAAHSLHPSVSIPAQASLLLTGLFQRLPKPGTPWLREDRERWVQTLNNVLLLEYPEK